MRLHGIDFSSAPTRRKPIVVASGRLDPAIPTGTAGAAPASDRAIPGPVALEFEAIEALESLDAFDAWLRRPGPWLGAFDFPFGWPRELIESLHWPCDSWAGSIAACAALSRSQLVACLRTFCANRAPGSRFAHRAADGPAGSSPSMKWVNPPVALMLQAGAPRLLASGVTLPAMHAGDPARIALEAYPGFLARAILGRESYKSDDRSRQTVQRRDARAKIMAALTGAENPLGIAVRAAPELMRACIDDPAGDRLDAVLCLVQAAWGWQRRDHGFGLPVGLDPLEGWIVSVPATGMTG